MKRASIWMIITCGILCAPASAENGITLYGKIDSFMGISNNNSSGLPGDGSRKTKVEVGGIGGLSGPRWGISGKEEISPGLKAIFSIESGFNSDTGTQADATRLFNREAYVGLDGRYGRLTMGRQYTAMFDINLAYAPQKHAPLSEPVGIMTAARNDNSVKYEVSIKSLTLAGYRAFGEIAGSDTSKSAWGTALNYKRGQLGIGLAYDKAYGTGVALGTPASEKALVTVAYNAGKAIYSAGYRWGRNVGPDQAITQQDNLWWIGGRMPVAPVTTLVLAYYYQDTRTVKLVNLDNPSQFVSTLIYALSKRTDLYGTAAYSHDASLNLGTTSLLAPGATSQTTMAIGIRHLF